MSEPDYNALRLHYFEKSDDEFAKRIRSLFRGNSSSIIPRIVMVKASSAWFLKVFEAFDHWQPYHE